MDIQATKLELMQLLLQEQKESVLEKLKEVFDKKEETTDWFDDLNPEQQEGILAGKRQADAGLLSDHDTVMKKLDKWRTK